MDQGLFKVIENGAVR